MAIETNTPAQRERLAKVKRMLAEGVSPYAEIGNKGAKDQGGLESDRAQRRIEALKVRTERSEIRTTELEAKWKGNSGDVRPSTKLQVSLGEPVEVLQDHVLCSFCQTQVWKINATYGSGKPRMSKDIVFTLDDHGNKSFEERPRYSVSKVVACPDCVNMIPKIQFPETEG